MSPLRNGTCPVQVMCCFSLYHGFKYQGFDFIIRGQPTALQRSTKWSHVESNN